ncbi:MAG: hypothetical protein LH472_08745 [Pyrinomonadaceae bacterium]|nr:hypothetical protein [Pyrinomonadaceae bacterium]
MIGLKEAVKIAYEYLKDVYDGIEIVNDLRLEEITRSEDEKFWLVTLGFWRSRTTAPSGSKLGENLQTLLGTQFEHVYKTIEIDANNGKAVSLKIREI